jgi:hypothetical protein
MNEIDPDNLRQYAKRLDAVGECILSLVRTEHDAKRANTAFAELRYIQQSLLLDAEEMRLAGREP